MPTKYTLVDHAQEIQNNASELTRRLGILAAVRSEDNRATTRGNCRLLLKLIVHDAKVLLKELKT
jgi:hypothetical protein